MSRTTTLLRVICWVGDNKAIIPVDEPEVARWIVLALDKFDVSSVVEMRDDYDYEWVLWEDEDTGSDDIRTWDEVI